MPPLRLIPVLLLLACVLAVWGCAAPTTPYHSREKTRLVDRTEDLQALIDQTPDKGTLRIARGRYTLNHSLTIRGRTHLTLQAEPGTQVLLTDTDQDVMVIADSRHIRVLNLLMRHVTPLKTYQCHGGVVRISSSKQITITNCELNGCGAVGISAQDTQDLTIEQCYIHNNSFNALYMTDVRSVRLWSNVIMANANGMQLYGVDDMQLSDNIIKDNTGYWRTAAYQPGLMEWTAKPVKPRKTASQDDQ